MYNSLRLRKYISFKWLYRSELFLVHITGVSYSRPTEVN